MQTEHRIKLNDMQYQHFICIFVFVFVVVVVAVGKLPFLVTFFNSFVFVFGLQDLAAATFMVSEIYSVR